MSEFLLELYSEEIPPFLQTSAREELKNLLSKTLQDENIKYKSIFAYSTPTRLTVLIKDIADKVKTPAKEIKGPKVGVLDDILNKFLRAHDVSRKNVFEKENDKGKFYFIKTKQHEIPTRDLLIKSTLNSISSLNWKKSMKWSNNNLLWGRPLRSILAIFNKKCLSFSYGHLKSTDTVISEQGLIVKHKQIRTYNEYKLFLKNNNIILNHEERKKIILHKFKAICATKNFAEIFNYKLLDEVTNIVENPNILIVDFKKNYLEMPSEIIISTLQNHQKIN